MSEVTSPARDALSLQEATVFPFQELHSLQKRASSSQKTPRPASPRKGTEHLQAAGVPVKPQGKS